MIKLGECLTIKHGWAFKGEFFAENGKQSILTPGNFYEAGGFKYNDERERYYTGEYPHEYLCKKGDLIVAMTEQAAGLLGSTAIVPKDNRYLHNQRIGLITCDEKHITKMFAYYLFMTKSVREQISRTSSGTKVKHTSPEKIYDVEVSLPDIPTQKKIAHFLWTIDCKIRNNIQINDNLQHQLKLLYDYWFTQFDFPNENGKPYRASGGAMVWCDALHQNIPINWNISSLGEICSFKNGINYEKDEIGNKQYKIVNVRNITASQMLLDPNSFDTITLSDKKADKYLIEANDFLIARSGSPGATRLLIPSTIPTIYCGFIICCSTSCELKNYIALTLKKLEIANDTKSSGSILKNVSQDTLKEIMLCIPQSKVLDSFNSKANSIIQAMQVTIEENNTLTALRDWLLPMLMNGQATISD